MPDQKNFSHILVNLIDLLVDSTSPSAHLANSSVHG